MSSLKAFYKKFGKLISTLEENYTYLLNEPKRLLESPWSGKVKHNFGIIDVIIEIWGNDRQEFQQPETYENSLTQEEVLLLNENFKCLGIWRNCNGGESAYYLIVDRNGNFGKIYYHQDDYFQAIEQLKELLKNGLKESTSLEDVLANALETSAKEMLEFFS